MEEILLFFSIKYHGDWDQIYLALEQKQLVLKKDLSGLKNMVRSEYLTIIDPHFPDYLKQCVSPPFVLYTYGNQKLLANYDSSIAVIGGMEFEKYGIKSIQHLLEDWCQKHCLIVIGSNMAFCELIMKQIAEIGGRLIVILHEGLAPFERRYRIIIEKFKTENLLIISEFYQDLPSNCDHQTLYHRLIVGMTRRLVFVEISQNEPNFLIFKQASREDKEIYSVPEIIGSKFDGSNFILRHRGKLVETGEDVFVSPIYH